MAEINVRVAVRFRPNNSREDEEERSGNFTPRVLDINEDDAVINISSNARMNVRPFTMDVVLDSINTTQESAFEAIAVEPLKYFLSGYNSTIFVYGQTGSGKTYTVLGGGNWYTGSPQQMGLIPRAVDWVYKMLIAKQETGDIFDYKVKCSFIEIYLEEIKDLLNHSNKDKLKVRMRSDGSHYVENLTHVACETPREFLDELHEAEGKRTVSVTLMNKESSRSHMISTIEVTEQMTVDVNSKKQMAFNFADLAGSEKQRKTQAVGKRFKEAIKINLSLTALAGVIKQLSEQKPGKKSHVDYRSSSLTQVLADSLGGNCRTTLIVNCSKSLFNREETFNTLEFAKRCKKIKNSAKAAKNTSRAALEKEIKKLTAENKRLRTALEKGEYGILATVEQNGSMANLPEVGGPKRTGTASVRAHQDGGGAVPKRSPETHLDDLEAIPVSERAGPMNFPGTSVVVDTRHLQGKLDQIQDLRVQMDELNSELERVGAESHLWKQRYYAITFSHGCARQQLGEVLEKQENYKLVVHKLKEELAKSKDKSSKLKKIIETIYQDQKKKKEKIVRLQGDNEKILQKLQTMKDNEGILKHELSVYKTQEMESNVSQERRQANSSVQMSTLSDKFDKLRSRLEERLEKTQARYEEQLQQATAEKEKTVRARNETSQLKKITKALGEKLKAEVASKKQYKVKFQKLGEIHKSHMGSLNAEIEELNHNCELRVNSMQTRLADQDDTIIDLETQLANLNLRIQELLVEHNLMESDHRVAMMEQKNTHRKKLAASEENRANAMDYLNNMSVGVSTLDIFNEDDEGDREKEMRQKANLKRRRMIEKEKKVQVQNIKFKEKLAEPQLKKPTRPKFKKRPKRVTIDPALEEDAENMTSNKKRSSRRVPGSASNANVRREQGPGNVKVSQLATYFQNLGNTSEINVGERVKLFNNKGEGVVMFEDFVAFFDSLMYGIELEIGNGENDGTAPDGIRYFTCRKGAGVFVSPEEIQNIYRGGQKYNFDITGFDVAYGAHDSDTDDEDLRQLQNSYSNLTGTTTDLLGMANAMNLSESDSARPGMTLHNLLNGVIPESEDTEDITMDDTLEEFHI